MVYYKKLFSGILYGAKQGAKKAIKAAISLGTH